MILAVMNAILAIGYGLEPISSTSRRGARAANHDEYPQDFGPRIAYTVF